MKNGSIIVILAFTLLFAGCGIANDTPGTAPDNSSEAVNSSIVENTSSEVLEQVSQKPVQTQIVKQLDENLRVDAQAVYLPVSSVNIMGVNGLAIDVEKAKHDYLKDAPIVDEYIGEDSTFFRTKNASISWSSSGIHYSTDRSDSILAVCIFQEMNPDYNLDVYPQKDLPFMSSTEAFSKVKQGLEAFGIVVADSYDYRALDEKALKEQETKLKSDPENAYLFQDKEGNAYGGVGAEHEGYFFSLHMTENGIPVCNESVGSFETMSMGGTTIEVIYSVNGFEYISARSIYSMANIYEENASIISIDKAISSLQEKYSTIILTGDTIVKSISLEYLLSPCDDGSYSQLLKPVWVFEVEQHGTQLNKQSKKQEEYTRQLYTLIDAVTGDEII